MLPKISYLHYQNGVFNVNCPVQLIVKIVIKVFSWRLSLKLQKFTTKCYRKWGKKKFTHHLQQQKRPIFPQKKNKKKKSFKEFPNIKSCKQEPTYRRIFFSSLWPNIHNQRYIANTIKPRILFLLRRNRRVFENKIIGASFAGGDLFRQEKWKILDDNSTLNFLKAAKSLPDVKQLQIHDKKCARYEEVFIHEKFRERSRAVVWMKLLCVRFCFDSYEKKKIILRKCCVKRKTVVPVIFTLQFHFFWLFKRPQWFKI